MKNKWNFISTIIFLILQAKLLLVSIKQAFYVYLLLNHEWINEISEKGKGVGENELSF